MANPAGESREGVVRLGFDRRPRLRFRGSRVTADAGLIADTMRLRAGAGMADMPASECRGDPGSFGAPATRNDATSVGLLGWQDLLRLLVDNGRRPDRPETARLIRAAADEQGARADAAGRDGAQGDPRPGDRAYRARATWATFGCRMLWSICTGRKMLAARDVAAATAVSRGAGSASRQLERRSSP
jgi:hypothetical protein